jgi:hypothetical protein
VRPRVSIVLPAYNEERTLAGVMAARVLYLRMSTCQTWRPDTRHFADMIRNMVLTATGFGFEIEVTAKLAKLGCALYEVPISYYGRTYEEGKKIRAKDAFAALWFIVKYNLFCGLKSSFHSIPVRRQEQERNVGAARGG